MFPPVFPALAANSAVTTLIGANPVRAYPFGEGPQDGVLPYVTWQTITGSPENALNEVPNVDNFIIQLDVWAETPVSARAVAQAVRGALEPVAYLSAYNGESRDFETKNYRYSVTFDFWTYR